MTWALGLAVLVRSGRRRRICALAAIYIAGGFAAIGVLSAASGYHYEYGDHVLNDQWDAADASWLFLHAGVAVSYAALVYNVHTGSERSLGWAWTSTPIAAEICLRPDYYVWALFGTSQSGPAEAAIRLSSVLLAAVLTMSIGRRSRTGVSTMGA